MRDPSDLNVKLNWENTQYLHRVEMCCIMRNTPTNYAFVTGYGSDIRKRGHATGLTDFFALFSEKKLLLNGKFRSALRS